MTGKRTDRQVCCDSPVGEESDRVQTEQGCCERAELATNSPRAEIEDDCCGTVNRNHGVTDRSTEEQFGGEHTPERGIGTEASLIAPNQKSESELERLERAAVETTTLLDEMAAAWQAGWSEQDLASFLHEATRRQGFETAWTEAYCPAVHAGPEAPVGHAAPGDRTVSPGEVLHVDFGIDFEGYVADLQRVFYRAEAVDSDIPDELSSTFSDVRAALEAGREALVPGVQGYQVDAVARHELTSRGWDAFDHAFGHQVGTIPHDRGTLLGPLWDRYGDNPRGVVRRDEVYSLELGVGTMYGYVGLEEMVRITDDGATYLAEPQTEIRYVSHRSVEEGDTTD